MRPRLINREIDNVPAKYPMLRFYGFPIPSAVGNGGLGEIWFRVSSGQPGYGANFRPSQRGIQRLTVKSLKCCNAHPGVHEHIRNLFWPDNNRILLRRRQRETSGQYQNRHSH